MSDPYEGEIMHQCPLKPFDFQHTRVVIVSGYGLNFCGHAILQTGSGWYFHVAGGYAVPKFMREDGYMRYLKENGKHEIPPLDYQDSQPCWGPCKTGRTADEAMAVVPPAA